MSIRDRLEGKKRRRCVVPVPVEDATTARQRVEDLSVKAAALPPDGDDPDGLRVQMQAARDALAGCVVDVTLAAPPAAQVEALVGANLDGDGMPDYRAVLPELLAMCAEEEDLQDAGWWKGQLERPEWAPGDVSGLLLGVLYLVADGPRPLLPKG